MDPERLRAIAIEVVISAEATARCPNHPDVLLDLQLDDDLLADRQTKAWSAFEARAVGEGFEGNPDLELQPPFIFALQSVDEICPRCGAEFDPPDDPAQARKPHPFA